MIHNSKQEAACLTTPRHIEMVDIPSPSLGPEEVTIDVRYVGLCGTDLNSYRGLMPLVTYPRVPGHEISGTVVAKGAQVPPAIREGDTVMLSPYTHCGLCPACRVGRFNCCQFNQTLGVQRDGALTRRFAIHYSKVFATQDLSLRELALVEPLSVGYHAANRGRVSEVDTVLVIGCGAVGIGVIAAAARKGATVIVADIDDAKLATARKFGAQFTVNSTQQDVLAAVHDLTDGEGVNVAIEAVGLPDTFRLAVEAAAFAGRVVYIGYAKKEVSYDTSLFVRKELDVLGSRNALHVFPAVIKMMEKRQFPFDDLITRVYPFSQAAHAFHDWDAAPGQFTKILIDLEEGHYE
ncbi:MAG: zinc-binding alcohol dehydrogenase family protein [Anaerolineae bacterium]|nr:zinc-binding alcohol dehydrogenase family protein [Anaerolineae bacterium]